MKPCGKIILIIIGICALPAVGWSQCLTLSEPLFLQAPDSVCAARKELVIKTAHVKITGARYLWRTPLKDTITADSILRFALPSARLSGNYSVAILLDTCQTAFFGPINVQVVGAIRTTADTIKTVVVCSSGDPSVTSKFTTGGKVSGEWFGPEGVSFDLKTTPSTLVKGVPQGETMIVWRLSTTVCPFFHNDTFLIRREIKPVLETDGITLKAGESSKIINLGQLAGSNLNLIKDIDILITKQAKNGLLEKLSDGKRLKYNRGANFQGQDEFELKVCNTKCPNFCSATIPYTIDVQFDERYPNVLIPKILAPRDPQNARVFIIEKIEEYPENELVILNRWGNRLVEFTNYTKQKAWDGTKNGSLLPSGAYYYLLQVKDPKGKTLRPLSGIFYIVY
jgi:gliding motility-associated-like protein